MISLTRIVNSLRPLVALLGLPMMFKAIWDSFYGRRKPKISEETCELSLGTVNPTHILPQIFIFPEGESNPGSIGDGPVRYHRATEPPSGTENENCQYNV